MCSIEIHNNNSFVQPVIDERQNNRKMRPETSKEIEYPIGRRIEQEIDLHTKAIACCAIQTFLE